MFESNHHLDASDYDYDCDEEDNTDFEAYEFITIGFVISEYSAPQKIELENSENYTEFEDDSTEFDFDLAEPILGSDSEDEDSTKPILGSDSEDEDLLGSDEDSVLWSDEYHSAHSISV